MAQFVALAERYRATQWQLDFRAAQICAILAEVNRDTKRRRKPYTPADFMPREEETEPMTDPQMADTLAHINRVLGGEER